jgi:uncharacterized protein (DUF4415 family)
LSKDRLAEILAFKDTDYSDCPLQTPEELAEFYPKRPENLKRGRDFVQVNIEPDIYLWFKRAGDDFQSQINKTLRQAMRMG